MQTLFVATLGATEAAPPGVTRHSLWDQPTAPAAMSRRYIKNTSRERSCASGSKVEYLRLRWALPSSASAMATSEVVSRQHSCCFAVSPLLFLRLER